MVPLKCLVVCYVTVSSTKEKLTPWNVSLSSREPSGHQNPAHGGVEFGTTREREKVVERAPQGTCLYPLLDDYFSYDHHSSLQHGTGFVAGLARPGRRSVPISPEQKQRTLRTRGGRTRLCVQRGKGCTPGCCAPRRHSPFSRGELCAESAAQGWPPPPLNQRAGGGICRRRLGDRDQ